MKTLAKSALFGLYRHSGAMRAEEAIAGPARPGIVLFHRVTDEVPEDGLTVSTGRFRAVCGLLQRRFRVVPLGEIFRLVQVGAPVPRRTVAITFDDCYQNNLAAARVLAEHGLPATFFIPTDFVGTEHTFPWDRHLKKLANLTWDEVKAMAALGCEIGSHTCSHADLGAVSRDQARYELAESKRVLEERLERSVRWFAFPYGDPENCPADLVPVAAELGYDGCLAGDSGLLPARNARPPFPRVPVPPFESLESLEFYLAGCLRWFYGTKRRLRGKAAHA
jgi:peptidoglycan/xylan/chitin deacetylase (PgdA/CDA1 family)